jgi:hypothetical protein
MTAPRMTRPSHEHVEGDARDEAFNRVARISAMLDAQYRQQSIHEEIVTRAMYIAAETEVHSRRGRDVRKR